LFLSFTTEQSVDLLKYNESLIEAKIYTFGMPNAFQVYLNCIKFTRPTPLIISTSNFIFIR